MSDPAELRILDADGNLLQAIRLQGGASPELKPTAPAPLPMTLAWYKESSTWLVTLATGAIVLGIGFFDKGDVSTLQRVVFGIAGLFLLIAAVFGVNANLFVVNYGNLLEPEPQGKSKEARDAQRSLSFFYGWMIRAFYAGIIAFAVFGFVRIMETNREVKPAFSFVPLTNTAPRPAGVIVEANDRASWLVLSDARVVRLENALPARMPAVRGTKLVSWSKLAGSGRIDGVPVVWMPEDMRRARKLSPLPASSWPHAVTWRECPKSSAASPCDAQIVVCPNAALCKTIEFVYLPPLRRFEWLAEEDVRSLPPGSRGSDERLRVSNGGTATTQILDAHGREVRAR